MLEAEPTGSGVSSRNSGVIHAGIYYPRGSLKGRACVDGRRRLYRFCEAHGVPHRRVGKLVVATHASQLPALDALREKAEACGVTGDDERLRPLDAAGVAALEPEVRCVGGVLSPSTGIVDAHELMLALQGEAEASGATVAAPAPSSAPRRCPAAASRSRRAAWRCTPPSSSTAPASTRRAS